MSATEWQIAADMARRLGRTRGREPRCEPAAAGVDGAGLGGRDRLCRQAHPLRARRRRQLVPPHRPAFPRRAAPTRMSPIRRRRASSTPRSTRSTRRPSRRASRTALTRQKLTRFGLTLPPIIVLLYARDSSTPLARLELGSRRRQLRSLRSPRAERRRGDDRRVRGQASHRAPESRGGGLVKAWPAAGAGARRACARSCSGRDRHRRRRPQAHQVNLSTARVELRPQRLVAVEVALKGSDVDRLAGTHVFDAQTGPGRSGESCRRGGADRRLCGRACRRDRRRRHAVRRRRAGGRGRRRRRHRPQHIFLPQRRRRDRLPFDRVDGGRPDGAPGGPDRRRRERAAGAARRHPHERDDLQRRAAALVDDAALPRHRHRTHLSRLRPHRLPDRDRAVGTAAMAGDQDRDRVHARALGDAVACRSADRRHPQQHRRAGDRRLDRLRGGGELLLPRRRSAAGG